MKDHSFRVKRAGMSVGLLIALVLLITPLFAWVQSQAICHVSVSPEVREVLVGQASYIELRIDNVRDLFGVQLQVTYAPSIIDVTDASAIPGVQVGAGDIFDGLNWYSDLNSVNETTGTINYVFALDHTAQAGVNGSGTLARIDFTALQAGLSPITYITVVLAEKGGESIDRTFANGLVRVVTVPSTLTPTPIGWISPTPTQTPQPAATSTPPTPPPTVPPDQTIVAPTNTATPIIPTPTPIIWVDPETKTLAPGVDSWIDVRISQASQLYGAWIQLTFDPEIVEILDYDLVTLGTQLEKGNLFAGKSWYVLANSANQAMGRVTYGAKLSFFEAAGPTGDQLVRVHFRTLKEGTCPFTLAEVILADQAGRSLTYYKQNGFVHVAQGGEVPTPTPTGPAQTLTPMPTATVNPVATPIIYIEPDVKTMVVGEQTTFQVKVLDVTNLYAVEFHVGYDPALIEILDDNLALAGTQISVGSFLAADSVIQNQVNGVAGSINFAISQNQPTLPKSGGGVLATFRVRAGAVGATTFTLRGTNMSDPAALDIPHGRAGAFVAINARMVYGHAYLQGRSPQTGVTIWANGMLMGRSKSDGAFAFESPVTIGNALTVQARFASYLTSTRTFVVPAAQLIDLGSVTLLAGDPVGPQAVATRTGGCPGDPTVIIPGLPDGTINIIDLTFVGSYFDAQSTDSNWRPSADGCHPEWLAYRADLNADNRCNLSDLVLVGSNFGLSSPRPW